MTTLSPNPGQQKALDEILAFLLDDNQKEFHLSGPAGTGKTFTMDAVANEIFPRYQEVSKTLGLDVKYDEVVMTATTNKAAEVLSNAIGRPTETIHSYLGYVVYDDTDSGKSTLKRSKRWAPRSRVILFIDECSMIDWRLHNAIKDTMVNSKIIYVGDHSQLAPVGEELSPIYKSNAPFIALTQQMRNNNQPALMNLAQQLRDTVATGIFTPIHIVPGVIDLLEPEDMQSKVDEIFVSGSANSRILCYTNKRVIQYNSYIRELRGLPEAFQSGERLVCTAPFHGMKKIIPAEMEVKVTHAYGPDVFRIGGVDLDVENVDISWEGNTFSKVPYATNHDHLRKTLRYFANQKMWPEYFTVKQNLIDLRPRDAGTVHKAQGSTYDSVFIDAQDISTCTMTAQTARLLYVAVTRPRNRIFFYGELAQKYGGYAF